MTILHGDDQVKVRQAYSALLTAQKNAGVVIKQVNAKELDRSLLEQMCGTQDLFASKTLLSIEGLFSLPKSAKKEELLSWLHDHPNENIEVVCVEQKAVSAAALKQFPDADARIFKLPMLVFQFVDSIGIADAQTTLVQFRTICQTQDVEFVFAMIIRHIRSLIAFVSDGSYEGTPFGRKKIERIARSWTIDRLLQFHTQLVHIDDSLKHSRNSLTLTQEIDRLLLQ